MAMWLLCTVPCTIVESKEKKEESRSGLLRCVSPPMSLVRRAEEKEESRSVQEMANVLLGCFSHLSPDYRNVNRNFFTFFATTSMKAKRLDRERLEATKRFE